MTRTSKKEERRHQSPKKRKAPIYNQTGSIKDNLNLGYKPHANVLNSENSFIPKIK